MPDGPGSPLVMMYSGLIRDLQLQRDSVKELDSGQLVDGVYGRSRKSWIFVLSKANQELYLLLGLLWLQSGFKEMMFIRKTRKGMGYWDIKAIVNRG